MVAWPLCPARNNMQLMNRITQQLRLTRQASCFSSRLVILALSSLAVQPFETLAQGTAFTYQGRLTDGAAAAACGESPLACRTTVQCVVVKSLPPNGSEGDPDRTLPCSPGIIDSGTP